jgi:hypothetical protein
MNARSPSLDDIFFAAREVTNAEDRAAYLDRVCRDDEELRRRVERLLDAQSKVGSFLEAPPPAPTVSVNGVAPTEGSGAVIGPYKLLEPIGEGGMGVVYMAEQVQPIRRKVALKIIKPGMDTKQVIARFEAERQALALMDHPNIARVLDAGATESGRPYFVMELVRGIPITEYCDREKLSIPDRLGLFVTVCQAVQHAHQKGIIHRDIKPSNVMREIGVTSREIGPGRPGRLLTRGAHRSRRAGFPHRARHLMSSLRGVAGCEPHGPQGDRTAAPAARSPTTIAGCPGDAEIAIVSRPGALPRGSPGGWQSCR